MIHRRHVFHLGLWGSAGALLSWGGWPTSADGASRGLRPVLTPFLDRLPLPPAPRPIDWQPNQLPWPDLDTEALSYVNPSQTEGKVTFYRVVAEVRQVKFHSQLPATEVWGYRDGHPALAHVPWTYALGPTFRQPLANHSDCSGVIVRYVNQLPTAQAHRGFGEPRCSVHLHGGHQPARFDGYPTNLTLPDGSPFKVTFDSGEHFDYAYPLVDAGYFTGGTHGAHSERASTMWYHDHIIDFTAQNVYRGLSGLFLVYDNPLIDPRDPHRDALVEHTRDTHDETNAAGAPRALRLPSGAFDIPLVFQEKTFGLNGELIYDVFNTDGFLGDQYVVNGMVQPYLPVKRRKYRLRFLNGSNARFYQLFLTDKSGTVTRCSKSPPRAACWHGP